MATRARVGDRELPLSVEALLRVAAMLFDDEIGLVWVEGEVSTLRIPSSGHLYFTLKDRRAQLGAVMWRSTAVKLKLKLEEGQRFVFRGKLSVFPEQGKMQLYVDAAEPIGAGAAAASLEQLKKRLAAEGLFDVSRKRKLPRLPRRIGVVTSATGAALRDIVRVIERRFPTPIVLAPCQVQGPAAAVEVAEAIRRLGRLPGIELLIVGRGGGSNEDLSAFNEEPVVRAIAGCPVPVISAVGHEIDVTLADLVADVRAATPTAAGEIAVPERALLVDELMVLERRLEREAQHHLAGERARLERLAARLGDPRRQIDRQRQRIDDLLTRGEARVRAGLRLRGRALGEVDRRLAGLHPRKRLDANRARLEGLVARASAAARTAIVRRQRGLATASAGLDAMSPLRVLERGYAIARTAEGHVVASIAAVAPGDTLAVRISDGEIDARVVGVRSSDPKPNPGRGQGHGPDGT